MLIKLGAGVLAAFLGVTSAATVAVFDGGVALVEVENDDVDLMLPVPMGLLNIGLTLAPYLTGEPIMPDMSEHRDFLHLVADQLRQLPDATFIEAKDGGERVTISRRGGHFIIDVDSTDDRVHVSLPVEATARLLDRIAGF